MELLTSLASWLTPMTLFLLLNFMIGTIFLTTRAPSLIDRVKSINFHLYQSPSPECEIHFSGSDPHPSPPSSLLGRVKSFNMPYFKFPQHNPDGDHAAYAQMTQPEEIKLIEPNEIPQFKIPEDDQVTEPRFGVPSLLQRVKSIKLPTLYRSNPDPNYEELKPTRTKSESKKPATKKKTTKKMMKSASEKAGVGYIGREEEETVDAVERRRPETTRVERTTSIGDDEEGVDDKASDFINKFKHQLKLQRLDSFLRYREMLKND